MTAEESQLREKILDIARGQIGQTEQPIGSNWGGQVIKYLESVGITTPAPWCAGFVYWCFREAMQGVGTNPLPRTGWTPLIHKWAENNDMIVDSDDAVRGDLMLIWFPNMGRVGHVGIVSVMKRHSVWTVDGNTNEDGGREGFEVARKHRPLSSRMIFVNAFKQ